MRERYTWFYRQGYKPCHRWEWLLGFNEGTLMIAWMITDGLDLNCGPLEGRDVENA